MPQAPDIEQVPWKYLSENGSPTYFKSLNHPVAVVLHVMEGYASTARQWAIEGHYGASWHFTVARDGHIMQHLRFTDGGYHAGIPDEAPAPTWPLWKGRGWNVNYYTIGIEHEGFTGTPFTPEQTAASIALCRWLSSVFDIPWDREHFPAHAEIDIVNRVNDFNTTALREEHYTKMFEEELVSQEYDELKERIVRLERAAFAGPEEGTPLEDRTTAALYRIAQINGDASDGSSHNSIAEDVRTALKLFQPTPGNGTDWDRIANIFEQAGKAARAAAIAAKNPA